MGEEIKKSGIKVFLDGLKTYWGYAATLFAIGAVIYAQGVKGGNADINSKVDKLVISDSLHGNKQDTILKRLYYVKMDQKGIRGDMTKVTNVVKTLSVDVVTHISKDPTVTKQDIVDIMGGLQFEISQPVEKSKNPDFKIIVKRVIK
jgi:hypothetical protein